MSDPAPTPDLRRSRHLRRWSVLLTVALVGAFLPAWAPPAAEARAGAGRTAEPATAAPSLDAQWQELQSIAVAAGDADSDRTPTGAPDPDGVADSVERVLGTDPARSDTDGDTLHDGDELAAGLDPRRSDTNGDDLTDNIEVTDTSGSIVPARVRFATDADNDDDGVPDGVDSSPFHSLDPTDRLDLAVTTGGGSPTYVDLQVTPADRTRLARAGVARDWPDGDDGGLMQDRGGASESGRDDVRVVPMLEVAVPDRSAYEDPAASADLQKYGIVVPEAVPAQPVAGLRLDVGDLDGDAATQEVRFRGTRTSPLTGATQVIAGSDHTCVLTGEPDAELWCWGDNRSGELGTGEPGGYHGYDANGVLEGGYSTNRASGMVEPAREPYPVAVPEVLPGDVLVAGDGTTCAVARYGDTGPQLATCWGENRYGQVGASWTGSETVGMNLIDPRRRSEPVRPVAIDLGTRHSCEVAPADGQGRYPIRCRGANDDLQLGVTLPGGATRSRSWVDTSGSLAVDVTVAPQGGRIAPVSVGRFHSCAIVNVEWSDGAPATYPASGRRVVCWGGNNLAQAQPDVWTSESAPPVAAPVPVGPVGMQPTAVAAGSEFTCVLTAADSVSCWGSNGSGQSNGGPPSGPVTAPTEIPLPPRSPGERLVQLTAGDGHACVRTSAGRIACWGDNRWRQSGASVAGWSAPAFLDPGFGPGVEVVDVAAGGQHTCAVGDNGRVRCWGNNNRGQLGNVLVGPIPLDPTEVGWTRPVETTGSELGWFRAAASHPVWQPESEVPATRVVADPVIPSSFGGAPSFGPGTAPAVPVVDDIDGDGTADVFLWTYELATGRLLHRVGWGPATWGPVVPGPTLPVGGNGNVATLADVDGDGDRDVVYASVTDLADRDVRYVLGRSPSRSRSATPSWEAGRHHRGTGNSDLVYVPAGRVLDRTGTPRALTGRVFLPAGLPGGEHRLEVRLVWLVRGSTDDPDVIEAATGPGQDPPEEVQVTLATYPDRFTVTGLAASQQLGAEGVVVSPNVADGPSRWAQTSRAALLLSQDWLRGTVVGGVPTELPVAGVPTRLGAEGLSVASRTAAYPHEDAAVVGVRAAEKSLLDAVPPGRTVAVLSAVEVRGRRAALGDEQVTSPSPSSVAVDLGAAPSVSTRTFDADYYDTTGTDPVQLGGTLVDRLKEWGFDDRLDARLIAMLVAWDVPETVVSAVDGMAVGRLLDSPAAVSGVAAFFNHWGWNALDMAILIDNADVLSRVYDLGRAGVALVRSGPGAAGRLMGEVATEVGGASASRLARQAITSGATRTVTRVKAALEVLEKGGVVLEVGVALVAFLAVAWTSAQDSDMLALGGAMAGLIVDLSLAVLAFGAEAALGAGLAGLAALLGVTGPPGWVAALVILVVVAVFEILEWTGAWKWRTKVVDWLTDLLTDSGVAALMDFDPAFRNLRSLYADASGDGLTVGDSVGIAADLHNREFPMGFADTGLGGAFTTVADTTRSWFSGGFWATPGHAGPLVTDPDPRDAGDWVGGEASVVPPVASPAPPTWPEPDPAPGRSTVAAWVVPATPDTDFEVSYQLETRAETAGWYCEEAWPLDPDCGMVFFDISGEKIEDITGDPTSKFTEPDVVSYDVLPRTLDEFLSWPALTALDVDADGLADAEEAGTSPTTADSDGDGLTDGAEVHLLGTDPTEIDADADGLDDRQEVELGTSTNSVDTDHDGVEDGPEVQGWDISFDFHGEPVTAHVDADPLRADSDSGHLGTGDVLSDVGEINATNPRSADTDGDGIRDGAADAFGDVPVNAYYEVASLWLKHRDITTGYAGDPTRFAPDVTVTRAQMAAFLWRMAGQPDAPPGGFSDVPAGAYYATAANWLKAEGITTGYAGNATRFAPDVTVTRAQMAAFLWRMAGQPPP
jgi:hypothetical protein